MAVVQHLADGNIVSYPALMQVFNIQVFCSSSFSFTNYLNCYGTKNGICAAAYFNSHNG